MKITNSKDGVQRMTIRVEHRLGKDNLIRNLCLWRARDPDLEDNPPASMSRARILEEVKGILALEGSEAADFWQDHTLGESDEDEIAAWATGLVEAAFAEFDRG